MFYSVALPKRNEKVVTVSWNEFFQPKTETPAKKPLIQQLASSSTLMSISPIMSKDQDVSRQISHSFDPLVHVIQGFSHPLAFIMISSGCILIMMNQKSKGWNLIKWAALGYILIWFVPGFMNILEGVGHGIESSSSS